jgi:hypothetical protein
MERERKRKTERERMRHRRRSCPSRAMSTNPDNINGGEV